MRKKILSTILSAILLTSTLSPAMASEKTVEGSIFTDVPAGAWYENYVRIVTEKGLMSGLSDSQFAPDKNVTRGMFVSVLHRLAGTPDASGAVIFEDVENGTYYEKPVLWAYQNGIVNGISDREFAPDSEITREQISAILEKYAAHIGLNTTSDESLLPKDLEEVSDWAKNGVSFCYSSGILNGDNEGNMLPKNYAKRSEVAAILANSAKLGTTLLSEPQKVKDGKKAAIAFIHDDGGKATGNWLVKTLPKYNIYATVGIIGKSIDPEYNVNEPDNFEKWQTILKNSNGRLGFAVHSHGHRYLGESDEAESGVLSDGNEYSYEKGHMTKDIADERVRINQMFTDERLLTFIKPGTSYPEGKNQVSDAAFEMIKEHYIGMRNTGGEVDTLPPADIYSVKSLMATASTDYNDSEKNQTADYWIEKMDEAIRENGMLVYLFHNINDESGAKGNSTAQSRVEQLFAAIQNRVDANEVWNGSFSEIMQYTQEFNAITDVMAVNNPAEGTISLTVTDSISKIDPDLTQGRFAGLDMFDYPITVKIELPYDWDYAMVTQGYGNRKELVKPFVENGLRYIYANVVPDQSSAIIRCASEDEYLKEVKINDAPSLDFDPSKYYYKYELPFGTSEMPVLSTDNERAEITQVQLDENGEGSAFITLDGFRYEFYFCTEKSPRELLLRIDTSKDDENLSATKAVVEYLKSIGAPANILDKHAYEELKDIYDNVEFSTTVPVDNLHLEFNDEYTEAEGDTVPVYNDFVLELKATEETKLVATISPESKSDLLLETFRDQIGYLKLNNIILVTEKYFTDEGMYVLAIGNSFSGDSVRRLKEIAMADGVRIVSHNAYVAGRPLGSHYKAWLEETDYRIDPEGETKFEVMGLIPKYSNLKEIIAKYDWDYITLQGTTHYPAYDESLWGVDEEATKTHWQTLTDGVSGIAPDAKRLVNATWAPINELAAQINDGMFENALPDARGGYLTQLAPHFQAGADIYSTQTREDGKKAYIPVAVAVDYLVRHYDFPEYELDNNGNYDNSPDTRGIYRDSTCHLTNNVGRVLAGLVWYEMLTGTPATENKYSRSTLSQSDMTKLKEAAHYACTNYSTYTLSQN